MNLVLREPWTVERFLAWEDRQEGKHEFDGTTIIEMTGGTRAHQRIAFNLARLLDDLLDADRFEVVQEMRITNGRQVRYPDVTVCAAPVEGSTKALRDAIVLFEVLSPDTAETDRIAKRADYAALPGLRRYVLLEQDRIAATATVLTRTAEGWTEATAAEGAIALPEIGASLPLPDVYRRVPFTPA
ncbi:MAG: Uma2 family endonuclease [Acetobacteraceae bacterium]|nr:Uma2 family endonuclease [Acetobacteraceae bacterium]